MFGDPDLESQRVIVRARDEALKMGHDYIGTEHLFLALLADGSGVGARTLEALGIGWNDFFKGIEAVVGFGERDRTDIPLTPTAQEALKCAADEASRGRGGLAGPEHLLLGLVGIRRSAAIRILSELSVSPITVRREVLRALRGDGASAGAR